MSRILLDLTAAPASGSALASACALALDRGLGAGAAGAASSVELCENAHDYPVWHVPMVKNLRGSCLEPEGP